jgi:16S rRNA (adenine1518-N6/adenine1519-N6)-dimethyltransferase
VRLAFEISLSNLHKDFLATCWCRSKSMFKDQGMPMTLYEEVRAALRESDFRPRKRFGQNFLIHERIIDSIIRLLDLNEQDEILEIGPGLGFLTRHLVEVAGKVYAVEVDDFLVRRLKQSAFGRSSRLEVLHGDILKISFDAVLPAKKVKVAGNLPYSISTPVLFRLLEAREHFSSLVLMVQREVADRIASGPGTKSYGTLSVWCQIHGLIGGKMPVAAEAFFPKPKVRSTILRIELFSEPKLASNDFPVLRDLLRAAFGQRRKTLGNAMAAWLKQSRELVDGFLHGHEVDPQRRGETLTIDEFVGLTRALKDSRLLPAKLGG